MMGRVWPGIVTVLAVVIPVVVVIALRPERVSGLALPAAAAYRACPDEITLLLDTNDQMLDAAGKLRLDPQIRQFATETKQQAYDRSKITREGPSGLATLAGPDTVPAAIHLLPQPGVSSEDLATQLAVDYPTAQLNHTPTIPC